MLERFAGLPVLMVQLSRVEIAGEVRAAHAPVNPFSEGVTEVVLVAEIKC